MHVSYNTRITPPTGQWPAGMASVVQDEMPCHEPSGVIRFVPFRESDLLPKTCSVGEVLTLFRRVVVPISCLSTANGRPSWVAIAITSTITDQNSKAPSNNMFAIDLRATWEIESMERNAAEIQP